MEKKYNVQVVHDIKQYDCVLTPLEVELSSRGVGIIDGSNADASVICQVYAEPPALTHPCYLIFHGVSVFKQWITRYDRFDYIDYVIIPGRIWELIKKNSSRVKTLPLGWTKADVLLSGDQKISREYILSRFNLHGDRPIILYAPTYYGNNNMKGQANRFGDMLKELSDCDVLFSPHERCKYYEKFSDYNLFINLEDNKIPYLLGCDLVVSDTSSISIEASLIDKPIVLLDNPKRSNYFTVKSSGSKMILDVGERVFVDGLNGAVKSTLSNPNKFSEQRKYWKEEVLGFSLDGGSTVRIVDTIIKNLQK